MTLVGEFHIITVAKIGGNLLPKNGWGGRVIFTFDDQSRYVAYNSIILSKSRRNRAPDFSGVEERLGIPEKMVREYICSGYPGYLWTPAGLGEWLKGLAHGTSWKYTTQG